MLGARTLPAPSAEIAQLVRQLDSLPDVPASHRAARAWDSRRLRAPTCGEFLGSFNPVRELPAGGAACGSRATVPPTLAWRTRVPRRRGSMAGPEARALSASARAGAALQGCSSPPRSSTSTCSNARAHFLSHAQPTLDRGKCHLRALRELAALERRRTRRRTSRARRGANDEAAESADNPRRRGIPAAVRAPCASATGRAARTSTNGTALSRDDAARAAPRSAVRARRPGKHRKLASALPRTQRVCGRARLRVRVCGAQEAAAPDG